jgi:hypothetical protein
VLLSRILQTILACRTRGHFPAWSLEHFEACVHQQDTLEEADVNASLALHTAARRYCLDRHAYWCARYSEIISKRGDRQPDGSHYTPAALATFPRYNVLNAIRVEVERIDSAKLDDVESTRVLLVLAGETAEDDFTRQPISEIDAGAMTEEREAFCRFIGGARVSDLNEIECLPYRRVLSVAESQWIWSRLRGRWQIPEGYWYPLVECKLSDIVAFKSRAFDEAVATARLRGILASRSIERVWELREYGPEYEEDVARFEPHYNGAEGYWSSGDLDWIMYASHESSVTVGGWLLQDVKAMWSSWQLHVWTGAFD